MENSQTSRRRFLSSLAILSACAPFASAADLFPDSYSTADLRTQWAFFCNMNGGSRLETMFQPENSVVINECKGHSYKTGELIYFSNENILAQPIWVYWGKEKIKPADVIINFFNNDPGAKKNVRINRFELEGMCMLSANKNENNLMPLIFEAGRNDHSFGHDQKLGIKTRVNKGERVHILASLFAQEISIEKPLTHNT